MIKKIFKNINVNLIIFLFSFILLNIYICINFINIDKVNDEITRIHVVANSNSIEDQIIKLKIYEKINNYIENLNLSQNIKSDEILSILENKSNDIIQIANKTLDENDIDYTTKLNIGKINYDEKSSITLDMPAGSYNSIQVVLGEGKGENIWSLMFPNKENTQKLKSLESILPGISNIYDTQIKDKNKEYSIKLLEIFNFENLKKIL